MKPLSAIIAAFLFLIGGYTVGVKINGTSGANGADPGLAALAELITAQQAEIADLRQAIENLKIPEPVIHEVIREIEVPVLIEVPVTEIVEVPVYIEPEEEPEDEEPRKDPEAPTMISYCLMSQTYPGGTFAYTFDGLTMTATLHYNQDIPPVSHTFSLTAAEEQDHGDLPVNPIMMLWRDGSIIYVDLIGNGDPPARQTIDLIPRGE